jgi:gliding motility-associated-like protein
MARPFESTIYQIRITDVVTGCETFDTITVIVRDGEKMFIPNAITPNGDGVNDVWRIRELAELPDNEVIIINRWGDEVFNAKPYLNDWGGTYQGKPLPAGTYYYILKLNDLEEVLDGNITIIK